MISYYVTRTLLALGLAGVLYAASGSWWMAIIAGGAAIAFFFWFPHSGRYTIEPEGGATPMRRDERAQRINNRAGRNGFGVLMLGLALLILFFSSPEGTVPTAGLNILLLAGVLSYLLSDLWMRRA